MKLKGVTLKRTYLTKNCKKNIYILCNIQLNFLTFLIYDFCTFRCGTTQECETSMELECMSDDMLNWTSFYK